MMTAFFKKIQFSSKNYLTKKNGFHHGTMNMHHITKSLFVGAAIAGIGMLSGRAEIIIGGDVRQQLQDVTRKMLQSHRLEVNTFHEEHETYGSFNYSDEMIEEDVKSICDALYEHNSRISVSNKISLIYTNKRESYVQLLNAALVPGSNKTIDWFFREDALGVFLRYHMFDICPDSLKDFAKEWEVFYFGAGGLNKYNPEREVYDRHIAMQFYCKNLMEKFIFKYKSTADKTQKPRSKRWSDFCKEHRGLKYFREDWLLDWQFPSRLTNATFDRHLAKVIFSKEYVDKIKEILYGEIFRGLKKDRNLQMRFLKRMCETNGEKEICRVVAACFHQYKKIKKAIDTNSVTVDTENMYERFLDVEGRLRSSNGDNKNAPLIWRNATKFSELTGHPVFLYMYDFLESMKADIDNVPELVKLLFTDPVYWAPAPVSDEEGAEILKELEEQEDPAFVVNENAPNAFLEQID